MGQRAALSLQVAMVLVLNLWIMTLLGPYVRYPAYQIFVLGFMIVATLEL